VLTDGAIHSGRPIFYVTAHFVRSRKSGESNDMIREIDGF